MRPNWRIRRLLWRGAVYGFLGVVLVTSILDHVGVFGFVGDDWANFDRNSFKINRAIEADVLEIQTVNGPQQVQLAGLYGPKLPNDHFAQQAFAYTDKRTSGKTATLRLEPLQSRDPQGRLIAHVYLLDTDNLNADMVKDGMVYADRRIKHSFQYRYEQLENEARRKKYGLWKTVAISRMPEWRQLWLNDRVNREQINTPRE